MDLELFDGETIHFQKQDDKLNFGAAAVYAGIGFAIVFFVLLILNLFIRLLAAIVGGAERAAKNKKKKAAAPEAAPAAAAPAAPKADDGKPSIPAGMKLADGSLGDIKLYNVDDATAAMIMAIVADKLNIPLNELHFKSIKEVTK